MEGIATHSGLHQLCAASNGQQMIVSHLCRLML